MATFQLVEPSVPADEMVAGAEKDDAEAVERRDDVWEVVDFHRWAKRC